MRVLHINCNYIGTTLHQLMIERLEALGYENQVFVPTYDQKLAVIQPNANVCVSECFEKWDRLFFDCKQSKILRAVQKAFSISSFDLIHAYTLFTDGNCAMKLAKKYNKPFVVAVRNTDVNTFFRYMPHLRRRGIEIMRSASRIFFLSDSYRRQVFDKYVPQRYHAELLSKVCVIPNGIDDFWFKSKPEHLPAPHADELKLIFAGIIDHNKNIPTAQRAVQTLNDKGCKVHLTVVGRVVEEKEFERIQADANTTYIPSQPKEKLIELYRQHDIFVMPSYTESFGLVYAEAMSQGLPVIYSKGQGFDGQFAEGAVGYHVEAGSAEEVANTVIKILEKYRQISNTCVDSANKFNWDKICSMYDTVYKEIQGNQ